MKSIFITAALILFCTDNVLAIDKKPATRKPASGEFACSVADQPYRYSEIASFSAEIAAKCDTSKPFTMSPVQGKSDGYFVCCTAK